MRNHTTLVLVFTTVCLSAFTASGDRQPVQSTAFSEVKITLDENFTLSDAQALSRAPGDEIQVSADGRAAKVQIPADELTWLEQAHVSYEILRNLLVVTALPGGEDAADNLETINDAAVFSSCSGVSYYSEYGANVGLPGYSGLDFSSLPYMAVTCIDVHYEVIGSGIGFLYIYLYNDDESIEHVLENGIDSDDISETEYGITTFNGEPLNQTWWLFANELSGLGGAYIDFWWIKLYYEQQQQGGYCPASGGCDEYIECVQVGSIDNSSDCDQYFDYTSLSTEMQIGTGYDITVTNGVTNYETDECGIWVDWNQDEDFEDTDEQITPIIGSPGTGPYTATITPPAGDVLGDTRMRIRICYSETPEACDSSGYGEVEDYTITVTESGPQTRIYGKKWHDLNDNGQIDTGEPALSGWTIFIDEDHDGEIDPNDITTTTDVQGNYEFTSLVPDKYYTVSEVSQAGWINTCPGGGGMYYRVRLNDGNETEANFGNYQLHNCDISGYKFYDANNNGVWNVGESPLSGWEVYIDENQNSQWDSGEPKTTTNASGYYQFTNLQPGYYNIMEVPQTGWFQTYPGLTSGKLWAIDGAVDYVTYIVEFELDTITEKKRFAAPFYSDLIGHCVFAAGPSSLFYCPLKLTSMNTADSLYFEIDPDTGLVMDQGVFDLPGNEIAWTCAWHKGILYVTSTADIQATNPTVYLNRYDAFTKELISRDLLAEGHGDGMASDPYKDLLLSNMAVKWSLYEINPDTADLVKTIEQRFPISATVAYTNGVLYGNFWGKDEMRVTHREDGSLISVIPYVNSLRLDGLAGGVGVPGGHRVWIGKHDIEANFGNRPDSEGKFSGTKYEDLNGNGRHDVNEPGLAGIQVYVDLDGDTKLDEQEPATVTDADGHWLIDGLSYGLYFVREVQQKGYTCTEPSLGWVDAIEVNQPRDIIFDDLRNLLYVSTAAGNIERFDLSTNQFLSPVMVGGSPHGLDITADYSVLYVADVQLSNGNAIVHKVNLNTLSITNLTYTPGVNEDGSYDIAIGSQGIALMTAAYSGNSSVPLYKLDTSNDQISIVPDVFGNSTINDDVRLVRSHDRSTTWLINNSSNGWVGVYDAAGDIFTKENYFNNFLNASPVALNSDGSMGTVQLDEHCRIVDSNLDMVMGIEDSRMAAEYSPDGDVFYAFRFGGNRLLTFDAITWEYLENISSGLTKLNYEKFTSGETAITADGRIIAVTDPNYIALHRKEYYKLSLPGRNLGGYDFGNKPVLCGDIDKDRDVDHFDLAYLCEDWLCSELRMDIAPAVRDYVVSMPDLARFANAWQSKKGDADWDASCDVAPAGGDDFVDIYDLAALTDEWLMEGMIYNSDVDGSDGPDGLVNMFDYACLAGNWGIDEGIIEYDEDFETGDFTNLPWTHGGDGPWTIDSSESFEGSYSAKSGDVTRYDESILSTTVTCGQGYLYFMLKINNDGYFRFYVDDEIYLTSDGNKDFSLETVPVTAGTHTFKWNYEPKTYGENNAWIDAIRFPPVND